MSAAVLGAIIALPRWDRYDDLRLALLAAIVLAAIGAVIVIVGSWCDRLAAPAPDPVTTIVDRLTFVLQLVAPILVVVVAGFGIWLNHRPQPVASAPTALPHDVAIQTALALAAPALAVLLALSVALARPGAASQARSAGGNRGVDRDVMGRGYVAVGIALLAGLIAAVFGGTLTLVLANFVGQPVYATTTANVRQLVVPYTVYTAGAGLDITIAAALLVSCFLFFARYRPTWKHLGADAQPPETEDTVATIYQGRRPASHYNASVTEVAKHWARSRLTDEAAVILFGLCLPTCAGWALYTICLWAGLLPPKWIASASSIGASLGVAATVAFVLFVRRALTDISQRKRLGFFWDVLTFWPRAGHPLGPPCYAERSIGEVVTRIRRLTGTAVDDTPISAVEEPGDPAYALEQADYSPGETSTPRESHSPVLLVGYSQGAPLATAVVAQLPALVRERVALLTLASPVRRLYGRAFPAYFGHACLEQLHAGLLPDRWCNLVRDSDYIGGYVLDWQPKNTLSRDVDHRIWDPPILWRDDNPAPPPLHLHSDWFDDPQTRPHAEVLKTQLSLSAYVAP
jgi:MFS family permease